MKSGPEQNLPDPTLILDLATAFWGSMVLFAANRLGIFTLLSRHPQTLSQIAGACGVAAEPLELLLKACVAHRLIKLEGEFYENEEASETYLVKGKEHYLGEAIAFAQDLYPVWGRLEETIRHNRPAVPPETQLGSDPTKTRNFVLGMHNRALAIASSLASRLDLSGRQRLFDVGGGPGTYSLLLVQKTPGLQAIVLDLPGVVEVARQLMAGSGFAERIRFMAGDYRSASFPGGNDVVLMSGMLHRETEATCRTLLRKAFESLVPRGMLVVSDIFFDDESGVSPPFATVFALTMKLTSEHGAAHAVTRMKSWMADCGFTAIQEAPLMTPMPYTVITGVRE